jgi:hypothetical protein
MADIKIYKKDGTMEEYQETSARGGSDHTTIRYEQGFVVIEDAYGRQTSIPSVDIAKIITETNRRQW